MYHVSTMLQGNRLVVLIFPVGQTWKTVLKPLSAKVLIDQKVLTSPLVRRGKQF